MYIFRLDLSLFKFYIKLQNDIERLPYIRIIFHCDLSIELVFFKHSLRCYFTFFIVIERKLEACKSFSNWRTFLSLVILEHYFDGWFEEKALYSNLCPPKNILNEVYVNVVW